MSKVRCPRFHKVTKRKITAKLAVIFLKNGGPEGDRTLDLTDANRTLSQTELRAQINSSKSGTEE